MTKILALDNPIRSYDWGSHHQIARIQGRAPAVTPEAELWIGDHPTAPSMVQASVEKAAEPLGALLAREATNWLGASRCKFGDRLPFLLKILAADQPLSLQVHPNRDRAMTQAAISGGPYVDANHKPEVLCALTEFSALHGFRPFSQTARLLASLSGLPSATTDAVDSFCRTPNGALLQQLLAHLLSLEPGEAARVSAGVRGSVPALSSSPTDDVRNAVKLCCQFHPSDAMVLAPLLLNIVHLAPGEALYTGAGTLHSYLQGTGVELMSTSDNVLRAGLTSKPIHSSELLQVTRFEPTHSEPLRRKQEARSTFETYSTPTEEFELAVLEWSSEGLAEEPAPSEVQVLLCTAGGFTVRACSEPLFPNQQLASGTAVLISAHIGSYELRGQGQLFRASVPSAIANADAGSAS